MTCHVLSKMNKTAGSRHFSKTFETFEIALEWTYILRMLYINRRCSIYVLRGKINYYKQLLNFPYSYSCP